MTTLDDELTSFQAKVKCHFFHGPNSRHCYSLVFISRYYSLYNLIIADDDLQSFVHSQPIGFIKLIGAGTDLLRAGRDRNPGNGGATFCQ